MTATARYALRIELADSTLLEPYHYVSRKDWAIKFAKMAAKNAGHNEVSVWVDDTRTDLGIFKATVRKEA
jgi:hypothetical protein